MSKSKRLDTAFSKIAGALHEDEGDGALVFIHDFSISLLGAAVLLGASKNLSTNDTRGFHSWWKHHHSRGCSTDLFHRSLDILQIQLVQGLSTTESSCFCIISTYTMKLKLFNDDPSQKVDIGKLID
jgi:hypothetical protein